MNTKWLIEEQTLTDIANSIREREGSSDPILVKEFANKIGKIEPSTEEYMRISDLLNYPEPIDENNYIRSEVDECKTLIDFYSRMEE